MSIRQKISAIIGSVLQLGHTGVKIKSNAGVLEARNAADNAMVVVRGLTAAGATDLTTKAQLDAVASGAIKMISWTFIFSDATKQSVASIPANARIIEARVEVSSVFDKAATITLGKTGGDAALLMVAADSDTSIAAIYSVPQDTSWGAGAATGLITVANLPTVGGGIATIIYCELPIA